MAKVKSARTTTHLPLTFNGFIRAKPPASINKTNGTKAGNKASDSIKSPWSKLNADLWNPQPGHSIPKYSFEKHLSMVLKVR